MLVLVRTNDYTFISSRGLGGVVCFFVFGGVLVLVFWGCCFLFFWFFFPKKIIKNSKKTLGSD